MRSIEEIKQEKEDALTRILFDGGFLRREEVFWIAKQASKVFESGLIEVATALPRISEDRDRIQAYNGKSVDGYHFINGERRRITQIFNADGTVNYYTDSKKEKLND